MPVLQDVSTPLPVAAYGTAGQSAQTAAFSPPGSCYLVALVGCRTLSGTPAVTVSDSGSHQWTADVTENAGGVYAAIWTCPLASAPGSITVTAANSAAVTGTVSLDLRAVTGTSGPYDVNGATGMSVSPASPIEPFYAGSQVFVAAAVAGLEAQAAPAWQVAALTTLGSYQDQQSAATFLTGRLASPVTPAQTYPGVTTMALGWAVPAPYAWSAVALEVLMADVPVSSSDAGHGSEPARLETSHVSDADAGSGGETLYAAPGLLPIGFANPSGISSWNCVATPYGGGMLSAGAACLVQVASATPNITGVADLAGNNYILLDSGPNSAGTMYQYLFAAFNWQPPAYPAAAAAARTQTVPVPGSLLSPRPSDADSGTGTEGQSLGPVIMVYASGPGTYLSSAYVLNGVKGTAGSPVAVSGNSAVAAATLAAQAGDLLLAVPFSLASAPIIQPGWKSGGNNFNGQANNLIAYLTAVGTGNVTAQSILTGGAASWGMLALALAGSAAVTVSSSDAASGSDAVYGVPSKQPRVSDSDTGTGTDTVAPLFPATTVRSADFACGRESGVLSVSGTSISSVLSGFAQEGFSLDRCAVLSSGSGAEAAQMYAAQSISVVPEITASDMQADDWEEGTWYSLDRAALTVVNGFISFGVISGLNGIPVSTSGASPGDYYALPLWAQYAHNRPAVPMAFRMSSRNAYGEARTLTFILYRVQLSVLDFTGQVYKTGLGASYAGTVLYSSTDEKGSPLPGGPQIGRIVSVPGTVTGGFGILSDSDAGTGRDTEGVPATDTGHGSDAGTVTAHAGDSDAGTGSELTGLVTRYAGDSDAGTGSELTGLVTRYVSSSDTATAGTDTWAVRVAVSDTGTGTGTGIAASGLISDSDTGTGTDIPGGTFDSDAGTGSDNGEAFLVSDTDAGTGTDTEAVTLFALVVLVSDLEVSAAGDDKGSVLVFLVSDSDQGSGTETSLASLTASDTAAGADAATVLPVYLVSDTDAGTGSGLSSVHAAVSAPDTATGSDAGQVAGGAVPQSNDVGSGSDSARAATAALPGSDAGTGSGTGALVVSDSDAGSGLDATASGFWNAVLGSWVYL